MSTNKKKRMLEIDWGSMEGAAKKKKVLSLRCGTKGIFECPVETCLHVGFQSVRGLRKHINVIHPWFYYFDVRPQFKREDVTIIRHRGKSRTKSVLCLEKGFGLAFCEWLQSFTGCGKSATQAEITATRALKYLSYCLGDGMEEIITVKYVDCCLGSGEMFTEFLSHLSRDLGFASSGILAYVKAIKSLLDFRKTSPLSDNVLRSFTILDTYLTRATSNYTRLRTDECKRNMSLENLIARDSWATVEDMSAVLPFHTDRFLELSKRCKEAPQSMNKMELAFITRFIITFLFVRVKGARPKTFKLITIAMFKYAKQNGGYIDQSQFKTADKYMYDTVILTQPVMEILQDYIDHARPLMNPCCDNVVVNTAGKEYVTWGFGMQLLVHEAIGKHIPPTRWRQILETASGDNLQPDEQAAVSADQKHSSYVAQQSYKKKLSRDVANRGREAVMKLVGADSETHTAELASMIGSQVNSEGSEQQLPGTSANENDRDIEIIPDDDVENEKEDTEVVPDVEVVSVVGVDLEERKVKIENIETSQRTTRSGQRRFTAAEDNYLRQGIEKYGSSNWSKILHDPEYSFQEERSRDSLRVRAATKNMNKKKKKKDSGGKEKRT
jgi:hypothetical protein